MLLSYLILLLWFAAVNWVGGASNNSDYASMPSELFDIIGKYRIPVLVARRVLDSGADDGLSDLAREPGPLTVPLLNSGVPVPRLMHAHPAPTQPDNNPVDYTWYDSWEKAVSELPGSEGTPQNVSTGSGLTAAQLANLTQIPLAGVLKALIALGNNTGDLIQTVDTYNNNLNNSPLMNSTMAEKTTNSFGSKGSDNQGITEGSVGVQEPPKLQAEDASFQYAIPEETSFGPLNSVYEDPGSSAADRRYTVNVTNPNNVPEAVFHALKRAWADDMFAVPKADFDIRVKLSEDRPGNSDLVGIRTQPLNGSANGYLVHLSLPKSYQQRQQNYQQKIEVSSQ